MAVTIESLRLDIDSRPAEQGADRFTSATQKVSASAQVAGGRLRDASGRFVAVGGSADVASVRVSNFGRSAESAGIRVQGMSNRLAASRRAMDNAGSSIDRVGSRLRQLATLLATGVIARGVVNLADSFTSMSNRLASVLGDQDQVGSSLARLGQIANSTRTDVGELVNLYARATLASKDLGVSQDQLYKFITRIGQAVQVSGSSTAEASGALRQLSQALGSGIVRAEEFNSLSDGISEAAQAIARGMDRAGGSVSKLRNEIVAGTVTSKELFAAFLKGSDETEKAFDKTVPTISGAFTTLTNNLTLFVGELDKANGISQRVGATIRALSENLSSVVPIVASVAAVMGARGLLSVVRSLTVAVTALGVAFRLTPVGAAVTLVTTAAAAWYGWQKGIDAVSLSLEQQTAKINALAEAAKKARDEAGVAFFDRSSDKSSRFYLPPAPAQSPGSPSGAGVAGEFRNGRLRYDDGQLTPGVKATMDAFASRLGQLAQGASDAARRIGGDLVNSVGEAAAALKARADFLAATGDVALQQESRRRFAGVQGYIQGSDSDGVFKRAEQLDRFGESSANSVLDGFNQALAAAASGEDRWKSSAQFIVKGITSALQEAAAEPLRDALKSIFSQLFRGLTGAGTQAASQVSQGARSSLAGGAGAGAGT